MPAAASNGDAATLSATSTRRQRDKGMSLNSTKLFAHLQQYRKVQCDSAVVIFECARCLQHMAGMHCRRCY